MAGFEEIRRAPSSPHTRRYFQRAPGRRRAMALFSAHAEVFPLFLMVRLDASSLLRTRGGISHYILR